MKEYLIDRKIYNPDASYLFEWAIEEKNRIKASKIWKTAEKMERRYRSKKNIRSPYLERHAQIRYEVLHKKLKNPPTGEGNVKECCKCR